MPENARNTIGSVVALIVGAILAAVTLMGLISNQVNSAANQSPSESIPYGTTG
ncbi:MAG TPA: hypothetical protein VFL69_01675 [Marmoricola sp.]|nr:hypothetical protein [Marmoricola sp.]